MPSFDIVCKINWQEIDNSVNSVLRELINRYDFKGAQFSLEIDSKEKQLIIKAPDNYKLSQIQEALKGHSVKRGIDPKAFEFGKEEKATQGSLRQIVKVKEGIDQESAKKIVKAIKDQKLKVQASIRGDEVRVEGKKIDDLQYTIGILKNLDLALPLQFINFRD